jgi:hypothetical protein
MSTAELPLDVDGCGVAPAANQLPRAVRVGVVGVCQVERAGMRGAGEIEDRQVERGRDDLRYPWSAPTRASMTCDRFNAIRSPLRGVSRALSLLSMSSRGGVETNGRRGISFGPVVYGRWLARIVQRTRVRLEALRYGTEETREVTKLPRPPPSRRLLRVGYRAGPQSHVAVQFRPAVLVQVMRRACEAPGM